MSIFSRIAGLIKDPYKIFLSLAVRGKLDKMDDKLYLKLMYRARLGRHLNLKNPTSYSEKMQWIKLYDRRPEYTQMVDKHEAKAYVAGRIGEEYIIPTLGVWDHFDDIDFDALPDQFVLKCTHDSGGLVICRDKAKLDKAAARAKLEDSLRHNYFYRGREWPYKDVKPRIIAEAFMEDSTYGELRDYKFYCFNGEPKLLLIVHGRFENETMKLDYFDMEGKRVPTKLSYPNSTIMPEMPVNFAKMRELAAVLGAGIPHVRVDFYEINGRIYFGELTFFTTSGFDTFQPREWDERVGSWIQLPDKKTV